MIADLQGCFLALDATKQVLKETLTFGLAWPPLIANIGAQTIANCESSSLAEGAITKIKDKLILIFSR